MEQKTTEINVVPSGEALSLAAKLLGVKSFDDVIASEGQQTIKEVFRPPLLGLGADPKKHGKALSTAMSVERKLAQRIKGGRPTEGLPGSAKQKHPGGAADDASDAEIDEEEMGRAGAISQRPQQAVQGWSKAETGRAKKKRKHKKQMVLSGMQ